MAENDTFEGNLSDIAGRLSFNIKREQEQSIHYSVTPCSLGPVYEFVCISFMTDNLNYFRVK